MKKIGKEAHENTLGTSIQPARVNRAGRHFRFKCDFLDAASILTTASAAFWFGSALAAPLPPSYPRNSAALFASVMHDPAEQMGSDTELAAHLQRQVVSYRTREVAGTIVIDTAQTYLYYVLGNDKAIRYGVGVGRDGFTWSGS